MRNGNRGVNRRQVKQVLINYTKAINQTRQQTAADGSEEPEFRQDEAQAILNRFGRIVAKARARDIPALALAHLPISHHQVVIVFDSYDVSGGHDDTNVIIIITATGAEIRWHNAVVVTTRGW